MKARVAAVSLGLMSAVAYASPEPSPQRRLTPEEVGALPAHDSGADTSGVAGIRTTVVAGDPTGPEPYTIRLSIAAPMAKLR
jgi:hypothetical protein